MDYFTGGLEATYILAAFFFLFVGILIVKLIRIANKDKGKGARGGREFSWKFWVRDNWPGIMLHVLIAVIFVRFTAQAVHYFGVEILQQSEDPMWTYVVIGFSMQTIIDFAQKMRRD